MLNSLKSLFAPPNFAGDASRTRAAQLNHTILLFLLGAVAVILPLFPLIAPEQLARAGLIAPLLPLLLALLWLNRRGQTRATGFVLAGAIWLLMVIAAVTAGGVRTPAYVFTIVAVIIAGFLLGRRLGVAFAVLTVLAGLAVLIAEGAGLLPSPITYSATALWVLQSVAIFTAALILNLARRGTEDALRRAERHEEALLARNETFRFQSQLLDSVRESVISTDLDGRVCYWGRGAEALYGYSQAEAEGRPLLELIAPADPAEGSERMRLVLEQGQWQGECRQRRQDGELFWAETSLSLVRDAAGQPTAITSIDRDVTERRQSEAVMRRSLADSSHSQRLLLALSQAGEAIQRAGSAAEIYRLVGHEVRSLGYTAVIFDMTDDGQLHIVHHTVDAAPQPQAGEPTGLSLEALRFDPDATPIMRRVVVERQPIFERITASLIAESLPAEIHSLARSLVDTLDLREAIGTPIVTKGALHGLLFVVGSALRRADVPAVTVLANQIGVALEQAQLLEAIQQQAVRLQRILDSVPEGLLVLDAEHRVQMTNPVGQTLLRQLARATVGERLQRLNGVPLEELLQPAAETLAWHELVVTDTGRTYELAATHLTLSEQPSGWILILRDVTDERIRQRYQQAQERLATVGHLAAGVAHDFNNIMAVITLYAQLLLRTPDLSPVAVDRLTTIQRQADRAASLIGQILDFSRRSVLEFAPIELAPFLRELLKLLERTFPETIRFSLETDDSHDVVHADPARLQQVFLNLSVNARDAMPHGGSIALRVEHVLLAPGGIPPLPGMEPGDWMRITVTDTGDGIAPDDLPHVFEPFFSTKPAGQGTGLGLAQAYGIVRQHGGTIDVRSTPGEGTTFTIYLPAMLLAKAPEAQLEGETVPAPVGDNQLVLVVEDDEAARRAVCEALVTLGYRVLEAEDGAAAVRLFSQHGADIALVLSDLVMPDLGGEALFRTLQRQRPGTKMILMTGYPLREKSRALLEERAVTWITKPFTLQAIADAVRGALATS